MDRNNKQNEKDSNNKDDKKTSSLSQLEQDIQAKNRSRGSSTTQTRPGAVSSSNNNNNNNSNARHENPSLSQLERDLAAKQTGANSRSRVSARPGAVAVTTASSEATAQPRTATSLSQLEQDIAAKTRAKHTPASTNNNTTNAPKLTQLEQDIAAKQGARASASRPGAVRSNGLSQLEQDIAAKASSGTPSSNPSLSKLEQSIAAKSKPAVPASRPGAVASGGNGTLTQLERDIAAKTNGNTTTSTTTTTTGSPSLTQLERDVVAKTQARGNVNAASRPGVTASNGLSQLERDIVQKTSSGAMGGPSTNSASSPQNLTQLESDLLAKARAGAGGNRKPPPSYESSDGMIKQSALTGRSSATVSNRSALSNLESEILRKNAPPPPSSGRMPSSNHTPLQPPPQQPQYPPYNPSNEITMDDIPLGGGMYDARPEEAPIYPQMGDSPMGEGGGIEAFVAEPNVVDAEAVEVIRTDEEEEVEAKKRRKKFLTLLIVAAIALLTIVIVPVALTTRRNTTETPAPTLSPTASPTMAPTTQDIPRLANDLRPYVQSFEDLTTQGTPQNSAMFWIALDDQYVVEQGWDVQDERFIQRFILAVIYFSLNGDAWKNCARDDTTCSADGSQQSWLTNVDECTWNLIDCDGNGRVTTLDNSSAGRAVNTDMFGVIPQEFSQLTSIQKVQLLDAGVKGPLLTFLDDMPGLETLVLRDSDFTGTIPSNFASKHPLLTMLDVHGNKLTGSLPDLGSLRDLTLLDLSGNSIVGTIPSSIGSLTKLTRLDLRRNELNGDIPSGLYLLTDLVVLDLGANTLGGSIPAAIGDLSKLVEVSLGPSQMTGPLPSELFSLTGLKILRLQDSSFTGRLRNEDFAQIADTISFLFLHNNDFSGPIPIDALETVEILHEFYVYGNPKLTGTITQTLCNKRGTTIIEIDEMVVGCNIICSEGCCADKDCPGWFDSQSELPE